jgi:hypothetical protein
MPVVTTYTTYFNKLKLRECICVFHLALTVNIDFFPQKSISQLVVLEA